MKQIKLVTIIVFLSFYAVSQPKYNSNFIHLPLDGNTNDTSINKNNAIYYGGTFVNDRYGKANKALSLDGVDDYILIKNIGNSLPTTNYSISFWLKTEKGDQKSANTFMLMPDNTDNRFSASIYYSHSGTSSHFVDFGSIGKRLFFQPDLPDGNWNFFEIIMTKDSLSLYKNGTLKSYLLSPDQFTARNGDLAIGMGIDGYIKGIIDDFKINIIPIVNNYNNNYDNVKFSLFPNPNNSNIFYFENSAPFQIISLCNNIGQNINYELSNNSLTIDANNGIYFIKCISNGDTFIKKLVINKL